MKKQSNALCRTALLFILALQPALTLGQSGEASQVAKVPDKILKFLSSSEMQKQRATFTGEVDPIPESLNQLLKVYLYLHRFTIVRMKINLDISFMYNKLIVFSDAASGDVVSYLWPNGGPIPRSFSQLLARYPNDRGVRNADVLSSAFVRLNALAQLIVYPYRASDSGYRAGIGGRVASLYEKRTGRRTEITAELIGSLGVYRLLRLELEETGDVDTEAYKYGQLSILDAETGRVLAEKH